MKLLELFFRPIAEVTFTQEELDLMCECSRHHYDDVCQQASKLGGFLYGMNHPNLDNADRHHTLDFMEVDVLSKILEQGIHSSNPSLCADLHNFLYSILFTMKQDTPSPIK